MLPPIAVYAVLERAAGRQLSYPGGAPLLFEAVDTELLARAIEWAATTPRCRNEIYNICNGDVFTFQNLWPTISDCFDMVVGPPRPVSLAESLPRREAEWREVVQKHELVAPPSIHDFVGESAELADYILAYGAEESPPPVLVSTIKARQHGFHDCIDTEDMLRKWIARYREARLLPAY